MPFRVLLWLTSFLLADAVFPYGQIKDSLVAPHMDDIAFMDTSDYSQRGGIWGDALKREGDESAWNNTKALATAVTGATAAASASSAAANDSNSATPISNPHIDGHGLAPGVPNLKLGDSKPEGLSVDTAAAAVQLPEGLRQRVKPSPVDRKVSDSSTTSGNPASAPPIEKQSKKKSWFSSSTSSLPAALGASSLSSSSATIPPVPALPASTSSSSIASTKSASDLPRTASLPVAAAVTNGGGEADGAAAVEKLRGILSDSHSNSSSRSRSSSDAKGAGSSALATSRTMSNPAIISDTASVDGYSLTPQRIISSGPLHRTPSASSDETTRTSKSKLIPGNSADGSADYATYLEETARATTAAASAGTSSNNSSSPTKSKSFGALLMKGNTTPSIASNSKPSLFRKKSDKSASTNARASVDDTSTIASSTAGTSTNKSRTPSARSASPVESIPTTNASASTGTTDTSTSAPEIRTAADVQAAAANVLAGWKAKAQDKQAIQEGVAQAKQQMAKWGNSWKAYRKTGFAAGDQQQQQLGEAGHVDSHLPPVPSTSNANAGDASMTNGRTRPSPIVPDTVAPNGTYGAGHIASGTAAATTSITNANGSSSNISEVVPSSQPTPNAIRRVPPPSTIPVHPAFSIHNQSSSSTSSSGANADQYPLPGKNNNSQTSHGKRDSVSSSKAAYRPAAMMTIPGMTEARRFQLSSEQAAVPMSMAPVQVQSRSPEADAQVFKAKAAERIEEAPTQEAAVPPALPTRPSATPALSEGDVKPAEEEANSSARLDDSGVDFKPVPATSSLSD